MAREKFIQLHVDRPCEQAWSEMRPEGNGRFCDQCQKTVVDFQEMSDSEIARILALPNAPTCGRFRPSQLERPLPVYEPMRQLSWPRLAAGAALFVLAMPHSLLAQASGNSSAIPKDYTAQLKSVTDAPRKTPWVPVPESSNVKDAPIEDPCSYALSGRVIDVNSGEPFLGAEVRYTRLMQPVLTDSKGDFSMLLPLNELSDTILLRIALPYEGGDKELLLFKNDLPTTKITIALQRNPPRPIMGGIGARPSRR